MEMYSPSDFRADVAVGLAFSASPFFEPFAIPLLLEKLRSDLPLAKIDSLKYLSYCTENFGADRMAKHAEAIWNSLRAVIYNLSKEPLFSLASDLSNSKHFQGNAITDEALVLLQKLVSQQNNGFLNSILEDEAVNGLINVITVSGNSQCSPSQQEQKLCAVGNVLSVVAKASTTSCNRVFETVLPRLLGTLGVSSDMSVEDAVARDNNLTCQRQNFNALYLCVEILSACRELAFESVRQSSNSFLSDAWCRMLASFSSSLVKAFACSLVTSANEVYHGADISLRVKGLQILAAFPGAYFPVSKSVFESILVKLVSNVTENFSMTYLWKASLNTLVNIGIFLEEYPVPEKLQSYMAVVVGRIILLISQEDSTMPYALILEAISDISSGGHTFKLRIVQGVQEAILAKFSNVFVCILTYLWVLLDLSAQYESLDCCFYKVYEFNRFCMLNRLVDGDLKSTAELEQLLQCYSNNFQNTKGSEAVSLCFAIDVWDKIQAVTGVSLSDERKNLLLEVAAKFGLVVQELLNAAMMALKLAVAICTEEDQHKIVENAFNVISSNEPFSSDFMPSQLERLQISQDVGNFTRRDEWLISLFASVIIALHPTTPIPHTRAVIQILLTAFLKGHVASAQALGSIVNKMPLKGSELWNSSSFCLDEALDLIFKTSVGSCSDLVLSNSSEISDCLNAVDFQVHCIEGLAWIGKGLLMRGHEKVKDITMIFLKYLVTSSEEDARPDKQSVLETSEEANELPSLRKAAADAFYVFMSDAEDCLNRTFHATVRPLYKQRFFSTVMPILMSAAKKLDSPTLRSMLYLAIGHVISNTPLLAVLTEAKKLLPVLLDVMSLVSEDILNKDLVYNLLLVLSGLLTDKGGQEAAAENAHVIINCLTKLVSYPHKMLVRETAVQCLAAMSGMPYARIYPMRAQVLRALSKVLDDPKRAVRQEAVKCRRSWGTYWYCVLRQGTGI
ncbi:hypothetical protein Cgig2_015794 [Carnegiea gigantea]|uniref:MMS19 nucleotide excision repair protein n=1 Tax=Carnegiea gigantea TaxID=171969 RepID=A0A9Q1KI84_9CARY|nr:hypothetical protein Cgig2_015794 [Carnegiea gigantea]